MPAGERRLALALTFAALLLAGCAGYGSGSGLVARPRPASGTPSYELSLLGRGPLVLPRTRVDGLDVGGLSAIARLEGTDTYYALVDGQAKTPARVFELAFEVTAEGVAPPQGRTAGEVARAAIRLAGFDGETLDGEGLAITPWRTFLVASEVEPSIREFSREGKLLGTLPVPDLFLAGKGQRGIRGNLGFESLALSPAGTTLWTANERPLKQDLADDSKTVPGPVRLLRYTRGGEGFVPGPQYVYPVEGIAHPGPGFALIGLSDLLLLPDGSLLALERELTPIRGLRIRLYRVSTAGATDVSGLDALAGATYRPVTKTLLYDFAQAGFTPDNLEGITWGSDLPDGDRTLVLVADDNFEPLQQTQLVALRFHEKR
ncbi:MAG TPA: esterase-like activity of phytase family protein [Thermoanaerobaculia bacterium]|jgi:hypothetical protein|nr:esterase-like activity of phytase family protein [Thermoanaerobaculia bacterium]